jgi:hypothetical protein
MWWFIFLILTIIYVIWLTRLINFGVQTATRIAVATETTALSVAALYQTLSPEGNLEQYLLSAISALAERAVAALVPR